MKKGDYIYIPLWSEIYCTQDKSPFHYYNRKAIFPRPACFKILAIDEDFIPPTLALDIGKGRVTWYTCTKFDRIVCALDALLLDMGIIEKM